MTTTAVVPACAAPIPRGDEAALFIRHNRHLLRTVRRAVNTSDAVVEDACAFAWAQLLRYQPDRDRVFGWLSTTAIREAWSQHARQHCGPSLDHPACVDDAGVTLAELIDGGSIEDQIAAREALRAVAALRPLHRRTYSRQLAGLSHEEIAAENDLTLRQVDRHLRRATKALRERQPHRTVV